MPPARRIAIFTVLRCVAAGKLVHNVARLVLFKHTKREPVLKSDISEVVGKEYKGAVQEHIIRQVRSRALQPERQRHADVGWAAAAQQLTARRAENAQVMGHLEEVFGFQMREIMKGKP